MFENHEIKPCPLCKERGNTADRVHLIKEDDYYRVVCGIDYGYRYGYSCFTGPRDKSAEKAIAMWNSWAEQYQPLDWDNLYCPFCKNTNVKPEGWVTNIDISCPDCGAGLFHHTEYKDQAVFAWILLSYRQGKD